ncbi:MAG: tyrosine-protein phosphatase [Lachnospiraceae bacterium]|nr:tyrosine-protein phosphatase [Lachnospiraceae bacterium]
MDHIRVSEPLRLDGTKNIRDMGGYPTQNGTTARGAFLRADGLQELTDSDIETLEQYGVRRVIDLRSDMEVKYMKVVFARQKEQAAANGIKIKDYMLRSKPEDMQNTLDYFHNRYTDAETYLLQKCGCSKEETAFLKLRLMG